MPEHLFAAWESYYVIVGSSAAALIGLQFVVIALVADSERPSTLTEIDAFSTPTVLHFGGALVVSAIMSAPWLQAINAGRALSLTGAGGIVYVAIAVRRMVKQARYEPVAEDWLWYSIFPAASYLTLVIAGITVAREMHRSLFAVGTATLLLLCIGIHNAWDTVTYIAMTRRQAK
jgi:hypothetical protein